MDLINDVKSLKLIKGADNEMDQYYNMLLKTLNSINNSILECDVWSNEYINNKLNIYYHLNQKIAFDGLPKVVKAELKLYWLSVLNDERKRSRDQIVNRLRVTQWIVNSYKNILECFNVQCIADIPYPIFDVSNYTVDIVKKHNVDILRMYDQWLINHGKRTSVQIQKYAKGNKLIKKEYYSPTVNISGDVHKQIVIQREQFKPISKRNIIYINDLYSEETTRSKDRQRVSDKLLNLYRYPEWMRDSMRIHLFDKIEHNELAPSTLINYFSSFKYLVKFLYHKTNYPEPGFITTTLIEDDFLSWGNENKLSGKNWFTNNVALLNSASKSHPNIWPALSVSQRITKKIKKSHYKLGLGRMEYHQECIGRSIPENIISKIAGCSDQLPDPISTMFLLALSIGSRSEDSHAILFDCLTQDPYDDKFMLLLFWQNKVSRWNTKPLLKTDPSHKRLIESIKIQRKQVIKTHKKSTKYLFPKFVGDKESFITPAWTREEIKKLIVRNNIIDKTGKPYKFGWHQMRHHRGTEMAEQGHDIVSIMMELGHTAPDMAANYINKRLQLKKKALMEKGGGRFYTIEGEVDDRIGDLLIRKEQLAATRVCGGACALPGQISAWCHHANACFTCKHFRADEKDVSYFQSERLQLLDIVTDQENEVNEQINQGHKRMSDIVKTRQLKNKQTIKSLENIIQAIDCDGTYKGKDEKVLKDLENTQ